MLAGSSRCHSPFYRPGSSLSQYGEKSRAPSVASRVSTVLPSSRPGSSFEISHGSSKTSRASTPLGSEFLWRADAAWPVREGGQTTIANSSIHIDMEVTRGSFAKVLGPLVKPGKAKNIEAMQSRNRRGAVLPQALSARLQRNEIDASRTSQVDEDSMSSAKRQSKVAACSPLSWGDSAATCGEERALKVRWSFQRTEEEIQTRLDILDFSFFSPEYRNAVYLRREEEYHDLDTPLGKMMALFEDTGLADAPQATHPANLDSWPVGEGGCAHTSELLTALEVINFYRWLCRVPRVQIDSYLQDMSNTVLQSLRKRSEAVAFEEASEDIDSFVNSFEDFDISEGLKLAIITHVPSCSAAMRTMFSGLPHETTRDGGPKVVSQDANHDLELPEKAEASMEPYMPLLRLVDRQSRHSSKARSTPPDADDVEATPSSAAFSVHPKQGRGNGQYFPNEPPPALPTPLDSTSSPGHNFRIDEIGKWRKIPAWGDTKGVVALRRRALDPRMRGVGFQRRGLNFCFWAPPGEITGMPEQELREDEHVEYDFLDPKMDEAVVVAKVKPTVEISRELRKLRKWQQDQSWKALKREGGGEAVPIALEDVLEDTSTLSQNWQSLQTKFQQSIKLSQFSRKSITDVGQDVTKRTYSYLKFLKEGKRETAATLAQSQFWQEADLQEPPVMVSFPPPGLVPMQIFAEAGLMPWTISPDPMRLAPTSSCRVQVFRVQIDRQSCKAIRTQNREVPLKHFCVDCTDVGTAFCVIFTPAVTIHAGDEFEVVLTGLVDRQGGQRSACTLQYFLSFANFNRCDQDEFLRSRAELFSNLFGQEVLWEPALHFHPERTDVGVEDMGGERRSTRGGARRAPRRGVLKQPRMEGEEGEKSRSRRLGLKVRIEEQKGPIKYDAKHPPSIGIVPHPDGQQGKVAGQYQIRAYSNEITVVFLVPSSTFLKGTLLGFVKSQAKWELLPHAVLVQSFDVPRGPSDKKKQKIHSEKAPEKISEAKDKHKTRVVMRIMIPTPGQYELKLNWGIVPLTAAEVAATRGVGSSVARFEHPVRILIAAKEGETGLKTLIPSLLHSSIAKFGYPAKHPLADQFGLTVLSPLQYRLKRGQDVRFIVHSTQAPLHEMRTAKTASAVAYDASAEYLKKKAAVKLPSEEDSDDDDDDDDDDEVAKHAEATRKLSVTQHGTGTGGEAGGGGETVRASNEAFRQRIRNCLAPHTRCGSPASQVCVAAVVGAWERVEMLSRRLLEPTDSSMSAPAEVHEALLRITEEAASTIQLIVFQVAADIALEEDLAAHVLQGGSNNLGKSKKRDENQIVVLGATPRPNYWVLAEFYIDSDRSAQPFDEEELQKPPTPPPDVIELIRAGRLVKLHHKGRDDDKEQQISSP
eukprot:TRINITY_DN3200_c0_g1_i1.p1 TRINITY_DN3200_c0_g1~~TRINITY_DN3200_c0_g1_i1.p1  ORF type:complete len:1379 (-),score=234.47 TRINITY_DN3200_c0_g1_i1:455-4591(-)